MTNTDIFLGSGATLSLVPETDLYIDINHSSSTTTRFTAASGFQANYSLVNNLYVGCLVELYATGTTSPLSTHSITTNTATTIDFSPACRTPASGDFIVIKAYGAPNVGQKNSSVKRLNADNWLGILESAEFPNVEVEVKQMNLSLGGSRNMSYQYKGIETSSGGNINIVANHGTWLYYALGACSTVRCTTNADNPSTTLDASAAGDVYIDTGNAGGGEDDYTGHLNQGPIFYKTGYGNTGTSTTVLTPPLLAHLDVTTNLEQLLVPATPNSITRAITYTFTEANGEDLPSFALEQSISKLVSGSENLTDTSANLEDLNFVRIARGNRVNTFTMTANENEEVKMTMDLSTRTVHKLDQNEAYESRGGAGTTNTNLFNFETDEFLEPFFFSKGSFSIFGQQFLKVTNMTLTINNNLQEKRFIGVGNTAIQDAIPSNRMYELSFTALVTDDLLFEELFNRNENTGTSVVTNGTNFATDAQIDLQFDKANGEEINISFKNYFLESANFTIPDDKGPITVEAMVRPRDLKECKVKTHWILQG